MSLRYFKRLETLDHLIRIKGTGSPKELANRMNISESTLYEFLNIMKDLGAPIDYCKTRKSYYYVTEGGFEINFRNY